MRVPNRNSSRRVVLQSVISHLLVAIIAVNLRLSFLPSNDCRSCHFEQLRVLRTESLPLPNLTKTKRDATISWVRTARNCPPCPLNCSIRTQKNILPLTNLRSTTTLSKQQPNSLTTHQTSKVSSTKKKLYAGIARVNRNDFARKFDVGVPLMPLSDGNNDEVFILYDQASLPKSQNFSSSLSSMDDAPYISSPEEATKSCMAMRMVLVDPDEKHHCLAIMGQWSSHYIYRWMRVTEEGKQKAASFDQPLRVVSRTHGRDNSYLQYPVDGGGVKFGFDFLSNYVSRLQESLAKLKPIAKALVDGKDNDNTIIVMTCTHGQSELLMNFVCAARARGLDTSQILLIATDLDTKKLGESLGLATFHDEALFGVVPRASKVFGDQAFKLAVLPKVFSVHMLSMLEYNVLLQDVDIIWFRHPLEYFSSSSSSKDEIGDFDIYFQDDGERGIQRVPYHANSGFFYSRYNTRTAYFWSTMIRKVDFILAHDDQVAVNVLLTEHASLTGLRVKTLNRDDCEFPGGHAFHHRPNFMKELMKGDAKPYIFHMSWTGNKKEKLQYLDQMGFWFVSDSCTMSNNSVSNIASDSSNANATTGVACCLAKPVANCHYRDKPSKLPCDGAAFRDKGRTSFW